MKLELSILAGAESKAFLADMSKLVERMERAVTRGKKKSKATALEEEEEEEEGELNTDDAPETEEEEEENDDFAPSKKTSKKGASSFDEEESGDETEEDAAEEALPTKKAKKSKITVDDVNDACMERAARTNRADVLAVLKKKFSVKSVTDLDPSDYEAVIKAMASKK